MTPLLWQSEEDLKSHLMKVKASEKAGLKLNIQKTKIIIQSYHLLQIYGGKAKTVTDFIFLGSKITAAMNLKDIFSLEGKLWQT